MSAGKESRLERGAFTFTFNFSFDSPR
jgi:hypothetical protein